MPVIVMDLFGSPYVGLYCFCNDELLIAPKDLPRKKIERLQDCLKVNACETTVSGSRLLGAFVAANSTGILLPYSVDDEELKAIKAATKINVEVLADKRNALGNLILANDKGAIVHPELPNKLVKKIADVLGVEVVKGKIGGIPFVGALGAVTNKGALVHPSIRPIEKALLEDVLKVTVETGTVNDGSPFIRSGILANTHGIVAGSMTKGYELLKLSRVFHSD